MKILINTRKYSKGAKALARALGGRVCRQGSEIRGRVIINWGDSECRLTPCLNRPEAIRLASNKREAFLKLAAEGVPVPRFATSKDDVTWSGTTVVRHKLTGHSGEGIELVDNKTNLPDAPLYVQYVKKEQEYRIHVGKQNETVVVFAQQRKARSHSVPEGQVNWRVRSHSNGFVFVREGFTTPDCVLQAATMAVPALGLDFGAVDVIYNAKEGKAYVLEINTAPGLEGQTVADYAQFFRGIAGMEVS